jgi:hypothetical protein
MRSSPNPKFRVGESLEWTKSFSDYSAVDYTLTYYFRSALGAGFEKVATASGSDFLVSVLPTETDGMSAGVYQYHGILTATNFKRVIDEGSVTVLPSLENVTTIDTRSIYKITLDNIEAVIAKKATQDQLKYTIGTRQLERYSFTELMALRKEYARLVATEEREAARANGGGIFRSHKVRFGANNV